MKSLVAALVVASCAFVSSFSFAQQIPGTTRTEVRAQLACAQQRGLMRLPKNSYPSKMPEMNCDTSGSGPAMTGNAEAGAPIRQQRNQGLYRHH
ncbi:hypothetical protein C0Z18_06785 [Trinickia dabaoshanensis]|uniref:DUF4148 domain-containing protein n=2 Tax=Trinickia dabaoshanensis TaxID=564714 RepID=A0A2N7VX74_9BURK|nr:DUF4148 domain-containing protein [Trinickia dabaoshanensis]PMS21743.1 hypothetical protein C0Z18_06785 [Trinickia dabaoshanensis]